MRDDPFCAGEVVGTKYVVERVIGVGGVGIVLAARHVELDELVAIKFLQPETQKNREIVRRFAREARAAVRIKSEYAARIFDVGYQPGRGPYFVMEYLDGHDLARTLAVSGPLPVKRAVEYILQSCEALAIAHTVGIVHRDIKPENLFVARTHDGGGIIKILDFGISKTVLTGSVFAGDGNLVQTQTLVGTPLYMSPEQVRESGDVDQRTDIWSLGVVLYELLSGHPPFGGATLTKVCAQVLESTPQPLSHYRQGLPDGLQAVIDRCLAKNPTARFQNVAELALALLPFGPTFARVSVERTATILSASGAHTNVRFRFHSEPPGALEGESSPPTSLPPTLAPARPEGVVSVPAERFDALASETKRLRRLAMVACVGVVAAGLLAASTFFRGSSRAAPAAAERPAGEAASVVTPAADADVKVTIAFSVQPPEAKIFLDDAPLAANPFMSRVARDGRLHAVRAEAPGFTTRMVTVQFDSDKQVMLALNKVGSPERAAPAGPPGRWRASPAAAAPAPVAAAAPPTTAPTTVVVPPAPTGKVPPTNGKAAGEELDPTKSKRPVHALDTQDMWRP